MLLYFDIYNLQIIKIKTVNLWIDFLDELGNFKQKKNYTFDFYTLQIFRVKQHKAIFRIHTTSTYIQTGHKSIFLTAC